MNQYQYRLVFLVLSFACMIASLFFLASSLAEKSFWLSGLGIVLLLGGIIGLFFSAQMMQNMADETSLRNEQESSDPTDAIKTENPSF